jgi:hypothetical protein
MKLKNIDGEDGEDDGYGRDGVRWSVEAHGHASLPTTAMERILKKGGKVPEKGREDR